jgi:hypothetical protein
MNCPTCGKDSTNRRVCPYCFTPYPQADPAAQRPRSGSQPRVPDPDREAPGAVGAGAASGGPLQDARAFVMRQTPVVRWTGAGILLVLLLWAITGGDDATNADANPMTVAGEPVAGEDLPPITREEALAHIGRTRASALVEVNADEVFVTFAAAEFPLDEAGQVLLVRRFAQADEAVEGRRRRIYFYNPAGRLFAQSDAVTGVTIKRS